MSVKQNTIRVSLLIIHHEKRISCFKDWYNSMYPLPVKDNIKLIFIISKEMYDNSVYRDQQDAHTIINNSFAPGFSCCSAKQFLSGLNSSLHLDCREESRDFLLSPSLLVLHLMHLQMQTGKKREVKETESTVKQMKRWRRQKISADNLHFLCQKVL